LLLSLTVKKLKAAWQSMWVDVDRRVRLGRILGMVFVVGGFVMMYLAWDGASGNNFIQSQFPYLLSGGVIGLAMVILGCTLWMLSTIRGERQVLTEKVDEMIALLSRNLARSGVTTNGATAETSDEGVVATKDSYHLVGCRVLEGKTGLTTLSVAQAVAEGLTPCRACGPPEPPKEEEGEDAPEAEAKDSEPEPASK
jgi:hypothetical protein